jgi:hypothetical protein
MFSSFMMQEHLVACTKYFFLNFNVRVVAYQRYLSLPITLLYWFVVQYNETDQEKRGRDSRGRAFRGRDLRWRDSRKRVLGICVRV